MGKKRKRPVKDGRTRPAGLSQPSSSTTAPETAVGSGNDEAVSTISGDSSRPLSHPVLSLYYNRVVSLRQFLLSQIPVSSRSRRKRIGSVGRAVCTRVTGGSGQVGNSSSDDNGFATFLDTTLVGVLKETPPTVSRERQRDLVAFTQSQSQSQSKSQLSNSDSGSSCAQAEIVDFVITVLFNRNGISYRKPQHLLTHGYQRATGFAPLGNNNAPACSIPGLVVRFPNQNVVALKQAPWTDVLGLLGCNGDEIMLRLLLDCGVFVSIDTWKGIYNQVSGLPLSDLDPVEKKTAETDVVDPGLQGIAAPAPTGKRTPTAKPRTEALASTVQQPNSVVFLRRRMLYARPKLTSKGKIDSGLTSLHVLSRYRDTDSLAETVHVLKYIFPRQFGLHNVFTSHSSRETALPFTDYSAREDEIARLENQKRIQNPRLQLNSVCSEGHSAERPPKVPKRLRGEGVALAQQMRKRHKRCSYLHLLNYYCPDAGTGPWSLGTVSSQNSGPPSSTTEPLITQPQAAPAQTLDKKPLTNPLPTTDVPKPKPTLTDHATPPSSVSAFCRSVLRKLIPPGLLGKDDSGASNLDVVLGHVDRFIRMRRYESLSLHEVCDSIKVTSIPWLQPPGPNTPAGKMSLSDLHKRTDLLHEIIYYIFDSLLIPLVRGSFYVTESQTHRNRLFYFRHDVWRRLTEKPFADLRSSMFEELKSEKATRVLENRSLGYGSLRLLPKASGVRPILNLRRRMLVKTNRGGRTGQFLGSSVNSTIAPIQGMLNYEKARQPAQLGACMYSVGEIHSRLKAFKNTLVRNGRLSRTHQPRLYFVKLDIQSCFDTIPQQSLVRLIEELVSEQAYHFTKHAEVRPADEFNTLWPRKDAHPARAMRKFVGRAAPATKPTPLAETIAAGGASHRRNTVFVDTVGQRDWNTEDLLDLLDEHVRNNLVKLGKKFFRQRRGIPQGSVLSNLLCNLFYAAMEREVLNFLQEEEALLLRLVDDFLLITSRPDLATRFLETMIRGQPAYGITVNPGKSLVNFAASVDGKQIPRLVDHTWRFPYCGSLIDTRTLEIYKDQDRLLLDGEGSAAAANLCDSLTVETTRAPGRALHRKVLASFKLLMHPMYLDTAHNSVSVVLSNLYSNFLLSAMKLYRYVRLLPARAQPGPAVMVRTIRDVSQLAHRLVQARREPGGVSGGCTVPQAQVAYLAAAAFRFVLQRKQTRYGAELDWLGRELTRTRPRAEGARLRLGQVVRRGGEVYGGWRF